MFRRSLACLALLLGLCGPWHGALAFTIAVLSSGQGGSYAEVIDALQAELRSFPGHRLVVGTAGEPSAEEALNAKPQLLVTVGTRAAQFALNNAGLRMPTLCVLLPRATYESLLASAKPPDARRISAIYIDQPAHRQLELIRQAMPSVNRVGIVSSSGSARDVERLQPLAEARGLRLVIDRIGRETELFPALQRVMSESDLFLALADAQVMNPDTVQNVLITSFRFRVPVFGYSIGYVRAGALAAVYSTPTQIGTQAGEAARHIAGGGSLPGPQYPRHFSVAVNRHIARSLDLEIEDEAVLRQRVMRNDRE